MSDAELEPDCEAGCQPPRQVDKLIGHDQAIAAFDALHQSGRLHHAWMLTGSKGVGKASLAYLLASHLLGEGATSRIRAQSHPNLLVIRRPWDDKRKKWRAEITMDEIRKVPEFFSRKAGEDGWRIAIIDSLDELNINSANGLLKTLEEPPEKGILFLVTHSPGRLLPTIRSRCRRLDLRTPPADLTRDWLINQQGISESDADIAIAMADGAPGRALALEKSGALGLEKDIAGLIDRLPQWDEKASRRLAAKLSVKAGESLRPHFYASLIRRSAAQARNAASKGLAPEPWLDAWRRLQGISREADAIYLDPKQAALAALSEIEQAARAAR